VRRKGVEEGRGGERGEGVRFKVQGVEGVERGWRGE
jgi:hypothetical protein